MLGKLKLGMPAELAPRAGEVFAALLRQSVVDSRAAGYHEGGRASRQHWDWEGNPPLIAASEGPGA